VDSRIKSLHDADFEKSNPSTNGAGSTMRDLRLLISGRELREPQLVELSQTFAVVGGSSDADVVLASSRVSFRHAYLQVVDGRVFCVDLGSKTGIYWGEERRYCGWISSGQTLRIGPYTLQVCGDAPSPRVGTQDDVLPNPLIGGFSGTTNCPQYILEFFDDSHAEAVRSIDRRITLLGRHPNCAVQLDDRSVSRVHCALVLATDGLWLIDLLGKDGTLLDGKKVRCGLVKVGSELAVGVYLMSAWQRNAGRRGVVIEESPAVDSLASATTKADLVNLDWLGTLFAVEQFGQSLVIVPKISGGMFRQSKLQAEANALRRKLDLSPIRRLVIDLHALDYVGSDAIRAVVSLVRHMEEMNGRVALCCAAPQLKMVLTNMGLCRIWTLHPTRETALAAIEGV
jgi:anti-anti-sigma factor